MAKQCTICGKGSYMATKRKLLRGNYNPTVKKRKYPNLQKKAIDGKRVLVCASCIKAGKTIS
ncbi:50S ribosomal protein L28 [bacterium]|nr:50S ribosomal protein L28 [bacterium]|tara:strand:+ start:1537 stop:1722 length:186 start_codon:yes stop_codon:yes gene_type:complete